MIVASTIAALAFLFLWQQLQATRLGYQVETARSQLKRQRDHNAYLRLELARLYSPERLAKDARERLRMSPPSPESLVVLGRAAAPATPATLLMAFRRSE